jgi:hypothetical protein
MLLGWMAILAGHVERMGKKINAYGNFTGKPEEKRSLGKRRNRCKNNIKIGLKKKVWVSVD